MSPEIITLGEPLVEFSSATEGILCSTSIFHQGFGGDTSNFAVSASRSGGSVGYITAVGADPFGDALIHLWKKEKIDVSAVQQMAQYKTGIYFIARRNGEHQFTYFREDSAASRMTHKILPVDTIRKAKILHMSGITQAISNSACQTNASALSIAKESKTLVTYDPNFRTTLWDLDRARNVVHDTVPEIDILFPSYDDAVLLTGLKTPEDITDFYLGLGAKTVVLKLGKKGTLLAHGKTVKYFPAFVVEQVDASGAGDTFCGAFAAEYTHNSPIEKCICFAAAAAALSTTKIGCVDSIPLREETIAAMKQGWKFEKHH